jgi:DNA-binding transcriptional ArsR family regulator
MRSDADAIDARVVKALAHPTRSRILTVLRDRELVSPVELSVELGIPLGTVGYHVRRLEALGFIELAKRTQRRGAIEHHYRVRAVLDLPLPAPALSGTGRGAQARREAHEAQEALVAGGFDAIAARADWRVVTLDARGCARLRTALAGWLATIERIEHASARRLAAPGGRGKAAHTCVAVLMTFPVADDDASRVS